MKSTVKNLILLSAVILLAVSCTKDVEKGSENNGGSIGTGKFIKRIEVKDDSSRSYDFEYDSFGRISKVATSFGDIWNYSYSGSTVFFESELYAVTEYLDDSGRLIKTVAVYKDGHISTTEEISFKYDEAGNPLNASFLYRGGNRVGEGDFRTYEYGAELDKFNIDVFGALIAYNNDLEVMIPFYSFPNIHNRNLCVALTNHQDSSTERFAISYSYNAAGNVGQINVGGVQKISLYY